MDDMSLSYRVSPFGNLRINGYVRLPEAYRSLSRPSSALSAKASTLRSLLLDLVTSGVALHQACLEARFQWPAGWKALRDSAHELECVCIPRMITPRFSPNSSSRCIALHLLRLKSFFRFILSNNSVCFE